MFMFTIVQESRWSRNVFERMHRQETACIYRPVPFRWELHVLARLGHSTPLKLACRESMDFTRTKDIQEELRSKQH